jgi:hypothetical protein
MIQTPIQFGFWSGGLDTSNILAAVFAWETAQAPVLLKNSFKIGGSTPYSAFAPPVMLPALH